MFSYFTAKDFAYLDIRTDSKPCGFFRGCMEDPSLSCLKPKTRIIRFFEYNSSISLIFFSHSFTHFMIFIEFATHKSIGKFTFYWCLFFMILRFIFLSFHTFQNLFQLPLNLLLLFLQFHDYCKRLHI